MCCPEAHELRDVLCDLFSPTVQMAACANLENPDLIHWDFYKGGLRFSYGSIVRYDR
jgi:hypothetical protein